MDGVITRPRVVVYVVTTGEGVKTAIRSLAPSGIVSLCRREQAREGGRGRKNERR